MERVELLRHAAPLGVARSEAELRTGLRDIEAIRSWAAAAEASIVSQLQVVTPIPEASIADAARSSLNRASRTRERSVTLEQAAPFDVALLDGSIVTGHVDELTRAAKKLDNEQQRTELFDRSPTLVADAANSTICQFRKVLTREVNAILQDDGMQRLERQRRATTMWTWTDDDGMWNLRAKFDPLTGVTLAAAIERQLVSLFAEPTPESCPNDPVEKQKHLRALALARLVASERHSARATRPEFVAVIDADQPNGNGEPTTDWEIPVEVPPAVIAGLVESGQATTAAVVVRQGVVLHAPGNLDCGRSVRHGTPAQRRALRALYRTCAIPGCSTHFSNCKLHHLVWWSNGGRTDLDNLLPVCVHHHHQIHDAGWTVSIDANRRLTVTLPDRTVMTTGPPTRLTS